jgi:hypothetical protein
MGIFWAPQWLCNILTIKFYHLQNVELPNWRQGENVRGDALCGSILKQIY